MEFSTNQEDIYNKLVNTATSSKYGKAVQVKYELTRPRKKQKKKNEPAIEIVTEENVPPVDEEMYSVPPDEAMESSDDDGEPFEAPLPPPRSDSLLPEPNNTVPADIKNSDDNTELTSNNIDNDESNQENMENVYAPCNWRQQNYESWTPFFKPTSTSKDNQDPPPPSQPPPNPPNVESKEPNKSIPIYAKSSKTSSKKSKDYEEWKPLNKDPPPPSQPPPQLPKQVTEVPPQLVQQPVQQPPAPVVMKPVLTQKKFIDTPKQITGLKKVGQPTPFLVAGGENLLKPSRPAPKPPSLKPSSSAAPPTSQPEPSIQHPAESVHQPLQQQHLQPVHSDNDIRLSPIKDSLPETDSDRLYEPCNWRRQIKDDLDEEMYGAMEDIMPRPRSPSPLGGSVAFARAPLRKSKSILKEKKLEGEEKKKKVRMLFPEDTVTPI